MQKVNYMLLFVLFLFFIGGCEKNKTSNNENNADTTAAADTLESKAVESGNQYKITLNGTELSPDTIKLTTGICYQLDFENTGNSEVEFMAGKNPSSKGFSDNFFKDVSVENIINNKEIENKSNQPITGIKLKPGEKGSLTFTPDNSKKGEWLTAVKSGGKTSSQNGVIVVN